MLQILYRHTSPVETVVQVLGAPEEVEDFVRRQFDLYPAAGYGTLVSRRPQADGTIRATVSRANHC